MPGRRVFIFVLCSFLVFTCKPTETTTDTSTTTGTSTTTTPPASGSGFNAVMWTPPNLNIPNFNFPEPEAAIVGWTDTNDQAAMTLHMWGIWTGLTQQTTESFDGQPLLVFETWRDPDDLIAEGAAGAPPLANAAAQRVPHRLKRPHQFFQHALVNANESTVLAFVKYDPTAAQHIVTNQLFSKTKLNSYAPAPGAVPNFPNTGLSLKPVFQTLAPLVNNRYYQLTTWPGSPQLSYNSTTKMWESKAMPQSSWGQCVWIDTQATDAGSGNGGVDMTCAADGSSRTDANTYGLGRFINFKLTQKEADLLNAEAKAQNQPAIATAGAYSALVAMHVTSREMTRWTWQTFWWVPNPDNPTAPSSQTIATARPSQLTGAARNYAGCTAYSMEMPPQPNTGGQNAGDSVYCFNPYLEAPFSNQDTPPDLPDSIPGTTIVNGQPVKTPNNVGPQTNCMACHIRANYVPSSGVTNPLPAPDYAGDRYTSLDDPAFQGRVKVDFLWSIPGNAK
jgi:hypothetical protein